MISSVRSGADRRPVSDRGATLGFKVVAGSAIVVVSTFVSTVVPPSALAVRLGLFVVALGLFAAVTVDPPAVALVGILGFGVFDGFLVNQLGALTWHGAADVQRLSVLVIAAVCGLVAGAAYRALRRAWRWRARRKQVQTWARDQQISTWARDVPVGLKEEEKRHA